MKIKIKAECEEKNSISSHFIGLILIFIMLLSLLLLGCKKKVKTPFECKDSIGCVTIKPGAPIEIGVLQVLSGDVAPLGITQYQTIQLAITQRGGQLMGHPIKLQIEDSQCLPEGGTNAAWKVITRPQVVAILGTTCSVSGVEVSKIMSEAGLVMISGLNSASSLTAIDGKKGVDWQPGYFRTMYNDSERGRAAATFVFQKLGITKVATIDDGDPFTQGFTNFFGKVFKELGGKIVLAATINKGDTNMQPVLNAVSSAGAELLFFPIFQPEGDLLVQQARNIAGLDHITFLTGETLILDNFIDAVGKDGIGMYFITAPLPQGPAHDQLVSAYVLKYGEQPQHGGYVNAHDATNLLLDAIKTVAVQETDGTLKIGRQALRDELYATTDFQGITGILNCDDFGDCASPRFHVLRLDDPTDGVEELRSNVVYTYTPSQ
jgi:branched-chain amino acid transport system substrate-binding protein